MTSKQLVHLLEMNENSSIHIMLPTGEFVPEHFHITEVGRVHKTFIDCGGTRRESITCLLQVWTAHDVEHRLDSGKLSKILMLAGSVLGTDTSAVEVEYEADSVSQYKLVDIEITPKGLLFVLGGKHTECLAPDKCGITGCGEAKTC